MPLHAFDHHDGVIDHESDRQDETKQRKCVDRKSEHGKQYEGPDKRNGNSEQRNESGAPALQEQKDHKDHQEKRDHERLDNFLDSLRDGESGIERHYGVQILGELLTK